jgi:hypothetical protein
MRLLDFISSYPIFRAGRHEWGEGFVSLLYTAVGGLIPVFVLAIVLAVWPSSVSWDRFVDRGEFAIYSVGLITPALLILFSEYRDGFPGRRVVGFITVGLLIFATSLFVAAALGDAVPSTSDDIDRAALRLATIAIYAVTVLTWLVVVVTGEVLKTPEPRLDQISRTGRLEENLDDLQRER